MSTIEIITTTLNTPVQKAFERKTQDEMHKFEVGWAMTGLYSLLKGACLGVVMEITYEQSWRAYS